MGLALKKVCDASPTVWNMKPAFVSAFDAFDLKLTRIGELVEVQQTPTTGVRKDKLQALELMVERTLTVAGAVFAYASTIGNQTLRDAMDVTETELKQGRDSIVVERCRVVHTLASPLVLLLAPYGVVQADLDDLDAAIVAFGGMIAAPRVAITTRKGATAELKTVLSEMDALLTDKMDKLMLQFKPVAPQFYADYFNARILVGNGGSVSGSASLQVTVLRMSTLLPLGGVLVKSVVGNKQVITNASGIGLLKKMAGGPTQVKVSLDGYVPSLVDVVLVNNATAEVTVTLSEMAPPPPPPPPMP